MENFNVLFVLTLSSRLYAPMESMKALKLFYYKLGDKNYNSFTSGLEIKNGMRNIGFTVPYLYCIESLSVLRRKETTKTRSSRKSL